MIKNDFEKFAISNGVGSQRLFDYNKAAMPSMRYISPVILEERQMNVTSMDVFSALMGSRIIFLGTDIDSDVANIINAQLLYLHSIGEEDIKMFINSPGGECYSSLSIIDTARYIGEYWLVDETNNIYDFKTCKLNTYCMGLAASMASVILSCGAKDKRFALPHSRILLHQPMSGIAPGSQASDIQIVNNEVQKLKVELYEILSENTGQPIEKITQDADRDFWLTAQEALDYHIIDSIITKKQ